MSRFKTLLFLLALSAQVPLASAKTITYTVGSCSPTSYPTIQEALDATPSPNVVKVCPGTYAEQLIIGIPVTVEGISNGNLSGATIAVPAGGLQISSGEVAAQVFVQSSGEVNLSNLIVDGTGNGITTDVVVAGVYYLGSPGTLNHLTIQNQSGNHLGTGILLQGGIPTPSVTVENSNLQGFDNSGIVLGTNSSLIELDATVKGNYLSCGSTCGLAGISSLGGATASISSNLIIGQPQAIDTFGQFSISKNTIVNTTIGIESALGSVTSNTIYMAGFTGIASDAVLLITGNNIVQSGYAAIDVSCNDLNKVHSNTILGAANGLVDVPTGLSVSDAYYSVGAISSGDGC
jgi:hypothetical protein